MRRASAKSWSVAWLIAAGVACSSPSHPRVGGESHWLAECSQDEDCGDSLSCVCGTCTHTCSKDAACFGNRDAACYDPNSPLLLQRCEDRGVDESHGVCLPRCLLASDCGDTRTCMQGACVPIARVVVDSGATASDASLQISDFDGVSDNVSWSKAVTVPAPQPSIAGGDDSILGTWRDANCDPVTTGDWAGCAQLVIERNDAGEVTGSVKYDRNHDILGPFALPVDPDEGYPVGVDPSEYASLTNTQANFPYRMLDGRLENGRLSFAWTWYDLWHDWCQLQKPYLWQVDGHSFYFCVPQDAHAQAAYGLGKVVLCTSADFQPLCAVAGGGLTPCSCTSGADVPALCSPGYCECDEKHCDAHRLALGSADLMVGNARMNGWWHPDSPQGIEFERVSQ